MFLSGVWHLDFDFETVTGLCYTHDPNFSYLSSAGAEKSHMTAGWWLAGWVFEFRDSSSLVLS